MAIPLGVGRERERERERSSYFEAPPAVTDAAKSVNTGVYLVALRGCQTLRYLHKYGGVTRPSLGWDEDCYALRVIELLCFCLEEKMQGLS